MRRFIDTTTNKIWAFEDDGSDIFAYPNTPSTLIPYTPPAPTHTELLAEAKKAAVQRLKTACSTEIIGGIDHELYRYPTTRDDQADINGLFSRSKELGVSGEPYKFMCADANGVWARRNHTAAQIQALGLAVSQHVIDAKNTLDAKLAEIDAVANLPAATPADLDAITW